jgi:hypothetical protein
MFTFVSPCRLSLLCSRRKPFKTVLWHARPLPPPFWAPRGHWTTPLLLVLFHAATLLMCCAYLAPSLLMYSWNIRAWIAHLSWQKVSMLQLHTGRVLSRPCCCPLFIFLTPCTPASLWTLLQSALAPPFATQAHPTFAFHLPDFYAELATGGRIHACS